MMRGVAIWAALLGACSSAAAPTPTTTPPPAGPSGEARAGRLLRPDQIFEILEASEISYDIVSNQEVDGANLAELVDRPMRRTVEVDPFIELKREEDNGRLRIVESRPPETIAEYFEQAGHAFAANELEIAKVLYAKALEVEPAYFKTYTYLGNTLLSLGEYHRAQELFVKALEINPVDYQAMIFLGDTFYQLGDYSRAKVVLTRAFMLNRRNEAVNERLQAVLAKLNLRVRRERLMPAVRIEQVGKGGVEIRIDKADGARWIALAACMACWAFEPSCRERSPEDEDPLRLSMYRECLINQAASISVRKEHDDGPVGADERILLQAIEDGFLDAIIFWEVVAQTAPVVILILPEALQAMILEYIEKYVFVSTQVV